MTDFTKKFRRAVYPLISPTGPSQNQSGRTVLITGGSEGIGFGIANAFAEAHASSVILVSRTQSKLDNAVEILRKDHPHTDIQSFSTDVSNESAIQTLWSELSARSIFVDVLVLNAAATSQPKSLLDTISVFSWNIGASLHMLDHFQRQANPGSKQQILLSISSASVHCYNHPTSAYAGSKAGLACYLCHVADEVPEVRLRIINLHPGAVYTAAADREQQVPRDLPIWDDPSLSAAMAVWVCGKDTAFLHGRYVWANWDAEELISKYKAICESDPAFMKIGITGVSGFTVEHLMERCSPGE